MALLKLFVEFKQIVETNGGIITQSGIDAVPRLTKYKGLEKHRRN